MSEDNPLTDHNDELIRQLLPHLTHLNDDLDQVLGRYRDACRQFRHLFLGLTPEGRDPDPLAQTPSLPNLLFRLRDQIDKADHVADALNVLDHFNRQAEAASLTLAAWHNEEDATTGH